MFQYVTATNCGDEGFILGSNDVLIDCIAYGNGRNGFDVLLACNFIRCTSSENTEDGFAGAGGSQFINCTAFNNGSKGIDGSNDSYAIGCVVTDNVEEGIEMSNDCFVHKCTAYNNLTHGIEVGSSCRVSFSIATFNNGDGIRVRGLTGVVYACVSHENDMIGIHCSSTTTCSIVLEGNGVTDNDVAGIKVSGSGALVIGNRCAGNVNPDFDLHSGTNHGPILNVNNVTVSIMADIGGNSIPAETISFSILDQGGLPLPFMQSGTSADFVFDVSSLGPGTYIMRIAFDALATDHTQPGCVESTERMFNVLNVDCGSFPWDGN